MQREDQVPAGPWARRGAEARPGTAFDEAFVTLFDVHFPRLFRCLDRMTGEPELAADLAQESFIRLYQRGAMPDAPEAWLISVALNLFRNERTTRTRRRTLLSRFRAERTLADPAPAPDRDVGVDDERRRVRAALDHLPERERQLLLLQAEGYGYREIAAALGLHEPSVGTLLARARRAFREHFGEAPDES